MSYPALEWYRTHVGQTAWMVCSRGHTYAAEIPHPSVLQDRDFKRTTSRCYTCYKCRQERHRSEVYPDMTGAIEAAVRLGGRVAHRAVQLDFSPEAASEWRGVLGLAALLWKPSDTDVKDYGELWQKIRRSMR